MTNLVLAPCRRPRPALASRAS